jgi:DnaK suppressor protein
MSLTNKELNSLRKALQAKRAELFRALGQNIAGGTRSADENLADPMDAANRAEEEHELLGLADRKRNLLVEIDHALAKLDAGTYGVSELSGRSIPSERLRAVPWARLTADEEELRARRDDGES